MRKICGLRGCKKELLFYQEYQGGTEAVCPCCGFGDEQGFCDHVWTKDGFRRVDIEREAKKQIAIEQEKVKMRGQT